MKDQENSNGSNKRPYVSVIIIAHDRKQYILQAIKSALNQTLDRSLYEIIVVKNFSDDEIDSFIEDNNIVNILTDLVPLGAKIALGVEKARGEVVSLLDDDDLFYSNKLEIIYNKFRNDIGLGYYHHNFSPLYENPGSGKFEFYQLQSKVALRNEVEKKRANPSIFGALYGNVSSISIRRSLLIERLPQIKGGTQGLDGVLFLISFSSSYSIVHEPIVLTFYRIHGSNMSSYFRKSWENFSEFSNYVKNNEWPKKESDGAFLIIQKFRNDLKSFKNLSLYFNYVYYLVRYSYELYQSNAVEIQGIGFYCRVLYYNAKMLPHFVRNRPLRCRYIIDSVIHLPSIILIILFGRNTAREIMIRLRYSVEFKRRGGQ